MSKIFITGGTGFIGAYMIKELIQCGYSVRAIRRSNKLPFFISPDILDKAEWVNADIMDVVSLGEAMAGADTVIHSAAIISFLKHERKNMYRVNVEGTANVVNTAIEQNVKRFIHISSISALGRTADGDHVNEEKKWTDSKLNTHYGISKRKAELEAWRGFAEGLKGFIVNPSTVLGYGDWNNGSCAIFKNFYKEFPYYSKGVNGFIDVEDVARLTVKLMEAEINEERFILSAENRDFLWLMNTIADAFGKKRPTREATYFLSEIAWRLEKIKYMLTGSPPLLTRESAKIARSKTYWENEKILKALPDFSFTPLTDTISKACKNYDNAFHNGLLKL